MARRIHVFVPARDGNDEVGEFPKTHEDVADIDPFGKDRLEPILLPVIDPLQLRVRSDIGDVIAFPVDDAYIDKGF